MRGSLSNYWSGLAASITALALLWLVQKFIGFKLILEYLIKYLIPFLIRLSDWAGFKLLSKYVVLFFQNPSAGWIALAIFILILVSRRLKIKRDLRTTLLKQSGFRITSSIFIPFAEVYWETWIGSSDVLQQTLYLWVESPCCPKCQYKLDRLGGKWNCVPCGRKFKIPGQILEDTNDKVTKVFTRVFESKGVFRLFRQERTLSANVQGAIGRAIQRIREMTLSET